MNRMNLLVIAMTFSIVSVSAISRSSAQDPYWTSLAKQNEADAKRYREMADDPNAPGSTVHLREAARISELNAQIQRDLANRQSQPRYMPSPYRPIPNQPWPGSDQHIGMSSQARPSIQQQQQPVTSNKDFHNTLVIGAVVAGVIFFLALADKK